MNYLAHLLLSGEDRQVVIGNFMGDYIKGSLDNSYSPNITKGIRLHRLIDSYTDSHEVTLRSKQRLHKKYGHFKGIIIDIFYDHFLAKLWNNYHQESLKDFASRNYALLDKSKDILPDGAQYMLPFMIKHNWLVNYSSIEGIQKTLNGMSQRTKHPSEMEHAVEDLQLHYGDFEKDFVSFFPEIQSICSKFLNDHEF